jgi:acetolactate synthase-1/3 small subunit
MQLVDVFRARVVDVSPDSLIIEITGTEDKIVGLVEMLKPYGLLEMARTGRVAMSRGAADVARVAAAYAPREHGSDVELDSGVSFSV